MTQSIYVSPAGNDNQDGSEESPFASLHRAQDEVRSLISSFKGGQTEDIAVHLAEGVHRLRETMCLDLRDSGSAAFAVTWEGSTQGKTIISSGLPLTQWKQLTDELDDIPSALRDKVWYVDLPQGSQVNTLYGPDGAIPRARGSAMVPQPVPIEDKQLYGPDGSIPQTRAGTGTRMGYLHDRFGFEEKAIQDASDLLEAEFLIIPQNQWTMNILPIGRVDFANRVAHLAENCTYPIGVPDCARSGSIWLENSLSVLHCGSWVFHKNSGRLYYCPAGAEPEENIEAPLLTEFIRVEGEHEQGGALTRVEKIHFRNLHFRHSRRFPFHGLTGRGIQHDWEMHDAPSCMLRFRHVQSSTVTNCSFSRGGSGGMRLDLAACNNSVTNSEFSDLGGCGVLLCGYGLSRHYLNHSNVVRNNHLHHLGLFYWHCPAIFIWQSGDNTISENLLHDLPYTGIVCSGRTTFDRDGRSECSATINWNDVENQCGKGYEHTVWHYGGLTDWSMREPLMHSRDNLIEYNRIHDVMQVMGDGNGIYISGAGGGNVVRFNVVGPCPSPYMSEGIRCDDDQHHTLVHGNLIYAQGGHATGITIKGVNRITNNILALPVVEKTSRGMLSLETGPLNGAVIKHNIIYTATPGQMFVSEIRIHGEGRKARLRDTESDHNIYYCTADPQLGQAWVEEQQGYGNDYASLGCDPGFVDAEKGNFNLKPDAPALKSGFLALPLERMLGRLTARRV